MNREQPSDLSDMKNFLKNRLSASDEKVLEKAKQRIDKITNKDDAYKEARLFLEGACKVDPNVFTDKIENNQIKEYKCRYDFIVNTAEFQNMTKEEKIDELLLRIENSEIRSLIDDCAHAISCELPHYELYLINKEIIIKIIKKQLDKSNYTTIIDLVKGKIEDFKPYNEIYAKIDKMSLKNDIKEHIQGFFDNKITASKISNYMLKKILKTYVTLKHDIGEYSNHGKLLTTLSNKDIIEPQAMSIDFFMIKKLIDNIKLIPTKYHNNPIFMKVLEDVNKGIEKVKTIS